MIANNKYGGSHPQGKSLLRYQTDRLWYHYTVPAHMRSDSWRTLWCFRTGVQARISTVDLHSMLEDQWCWDRALSWFSLECTKSWVHASARQFDPLSVGPPVQHEQVYLWTKRLEPIRKKLLGNEGSAISNGPVSPFNHHQCLLLTVCPTLGSHSEVSQIWTHWWKAGLRERRWSDSDWTKGLVGWRKNNHPMKRKITQEAQTHHNSSWTKTTQIEFGAAYTARLKSWDRSFHLRPQ